MPCLHGASRHASHYQSRSGTARASCWRCASMANLPTTRNLIARVISIRIFRKDIKSVSTNIRSFLAVSLLVSPSRAFILKKTPRAQSFKREKSLVDFQPRWRAAHGACHRTGYSRCRDSREVRTRIATLLRTLGASHANLEKGEMRVEANISISKSDTTWYQSRSEKLELVSLSRTRNYIRS